jgi:membrane-associated protein
VETVTTLALGDPLAINPLNAAELVAAFGTVGVLAILFAETGLLVGFFFPGDSLLFLAGIAASPFANEILPGVQLELWHLLLGAPICAILGAQLGHMLGARYGRRMFDRPNSRLFRPEYVEKAEYYFQKFGPAKAVVLARFIPIVRTFLNPVAGVLEMPARTFFLWNVIGGILWTDGILLVGYSVARQITEFIPAEDIDKFLLPVIIFIVLLSAMPIFIEIWRSRREAKRARLAAVAAGDSGLAPDAEVGRHRV